MRIVKGMRTIVSALLAVSCLTLGESNAAESNRDPYSDARPAEVSAWRRDVSITLPNGVSYDYVLRRTPPLIAPVSDHFVEEYPSLEAMALAGRSDAAHALFVGLRVCRGAWRNLKALDSAVVSLRNDRVLRRPGHLDHPLGEHDDVSYLEAQALRAPYEFCNGLSDEQLALKEHWRDVAADLGNFWAIKEQAQALGRSEKAIAAWERAWKAGSMMALGQLASLYGFGSAETPNRVPAYAYALIFERIFKSSTTVVPGQARVTASVAVSDGLARWSESMSDADRAAGLKMAEDILAASPNCCFLD